MTNGEMGCFLADLYVTLTPMLLIAPKQNWCHFEALECIFHLNLKKNSLRQSADSQSTKYSVSEHMVDPVVYIIMLHSPMLQIFLDLFCFSTDKIDRDQRALTADVTVVIRDDIGSRAVLTPFRGLMSGTTSIIVKQDFLFHKFTLAHAIGHMIGCGHEKTTSNMFHTTGWKSKKVRPKEWPQFLKCCDFFDNFFTTIIH